MFSQRGSTRKSLTLLSVLVIAGAWLAGCEKDGGERQWSPHYRKAVRAYRQGDYARAVELFEKALVFEPSKAEIYLDIAAIHDDFLNNAPAAISNYEKYLQHAGGGEMAEWVKRWLADARRRLAAAPEESQPAETEVNADTDTDKVIETLREQLLASERALAQERKENTGLSEQVSTLSRELSAAREEKKNLEARLAVYSDPDGGAEGGGVPGRGTGGDRDAFPKRGRTLPLSWLLCMALSVLVVALILGQRHARTREKSLLDSIQAGASGSMEDIRKEDILGKYYWVENDHSAGILSFTEKDDEIYACAVDGTTGVRSRGEGKLVGNVLTAELRTGGEQSVVTKFIFANKGRTVTAVWQGEEGTCVAAGTKAVGE